MMVQSDNIQELTGVFRLIKQTIHFNIYDVKIGEIRGSLYVPLGTVLSHRLILDEVDDKGKEV